MGPLKFTQVILHYPFRIKYYLNSKDTRMYMVTRDLAMSYVTGLVYDMAGNAIDDIDLS